MPKRLTITIAALALTIAAAAQLNSDSIMRQFDSPTFVPMVRLSQVLDKNGDSIQYMEMNDVYVFPTVEFQSEKQMKSYLLLVRNVKKVLPLAKEVNGIIKETYEYLQTLPEGKARQEHMKRVEKSIYKTYKPQMKRLTYSQGKLLIKLVYRECNSSSYDILKAFLGPVRAGFWQAFGAVFGASLKKEYDPNGADRLTERIVLLVEAGQL